MNTLARRFLMCFCLLLPMLAVGCVKVAPPPPPMPPPPDVVSRVTSAKKIFLSNAGADVVFASDMVGGADGSYNELYASLKRWGHFELVDSPAQADLIFELSSTQQSDDVEHTGRGLHPDDYTVTSYPPFFHLLIFDPSTGTPLYTIVSGAGYAPSLKQGQINFAISIGKLTDQIKALVGETSTQATTPTLVEAQAALQAAAPVPGQVRAAKKVFMQNDGATGYRYDHFVAALSTWGYYTLVDTPEKADVVFDFQPDAIAVLLPAGKITLWTVSDPLSTSRQEQGKNADGVIIRSLISRLKSIAGVS